MLLAKTEGIRLLYKNDMLARNANGGLPSTKDILAEITNTTRYNSGEMTLTRPRTRLGAWLSNAEGKIVAYMSISVLRSANPTSHEHQFVWEGTCHNPVSGIFIRKMITTKGERGKGYGAMLLSEALSLANCLGLHVYCDTHANNAGMRAFLRREGARESIFWFTKNRTLMVRYMWM